MGAISAAGWPIRAADCGLLGALSLTLSCALRALVAVGLKVTAIVQLAPGARLEPQLLVCAKSPGLVPPIEIPLMLSDAPPSLFFSVKFLAGLVVPTLCGGNA